MVVLIVDAQMNDPDMTILGVWLVCTGLKLPDLKTFTSLSLLFHHTFTSAMSKRHAELPLGESFPESPASKKARLENGNESSSRDSTAPAQQANGQDDSNGANNLESTSKEAKELQPDAQDDSDLSDIDEDASALSAPKRQNQPMEGYGDLYLDTVNRGILDFDFEKLCSISLSNINVYACLVCGKYFQGRGPKSHAYFHALEVGHHVFVNMGTKKVYVLPEGYEVKSKSLDDIKYVVDPHYSKEQVMKMDKEVQDARDLKGALYRPGETLRLTEDPRKS